MRTHGRQLIVASTSSSIAATSPTPPPSSGAPGRRRPRVRHPLAHALRCGGGGLGRRRSLFLGPADAPAVHRVLDEGPRRRTVVWTNRMPLAYLEGREDLVRGPSKPRTAARPPRYDHPRSTRPSLPCRERTAARCVRRVLRLLPRGRDRPRRVAGADRAVGSRRGRRTRLRRIPPPAAYGCAPDRLRPGAQPRGAAGGAFPASRGAAGRLATSLAACRPGRHCSFGTPDPDVRCRGVAACQARGGRSAHRGAGAREPSALVPEPGRLVPALPDVATGRRDGWPLERGSAARVRRWLGAARAVEGLPPCLAGRRKVRAAPEPFDLRWLGADGRVDRYAVLHDFVEESHRAWSLRCAGCAARRGCGGLGWEMARTVGLGVLRPFPRA